jgi:hypothetical protein
MWLIPRKNGTSPTMGACLGMHISIFVFIIQQLHGYSARRELRGHVLTCLIGHVWADHGNDMIIVIHLCGLTNRVQDCRYQFKFDLKSWRIARRGMTLIQTTRKVGYQMQGACVHEI